MSPKPRIELRSIERVLRKGSPAERIAGRGPAGGAHRFGGDGAWRAALALSLVDFHRAYNRLLEALPGTLESSLRERSFRTRPLGWLFVGLAVAALIATVAFALFDAVFEAIEIAVGAGMADLKEIGAIAVVTVLLGETRGAVKGLERAAHPEDYELLYRSPVPASAFVLCRFLLAAAVRSTLIWLFVVGPAVAASIWILGNSPLAFLAWAALYAPFLAAVVTLRSAWGVVGYRIKSSTHAAFGSSAAGIALGCGVAAGLAGVLALLVTRLLGGVQEVVASIRTFLASRSVETFAERAWLPSNWFVFSLADAASGRAVSAFWWTVLAYVVVVPVAIIVMWATARLIPMGSQWGYERSMREGGVTRFVASGVSAVAGRFGPILAKDLRALSRATPVVRRRFSTMLFLMATLIGFVVGLGVGGAYQAHSWQAVFPLLIFSYTLCSFAGEALLPVTAIDAEGEAIDLFRRASVPLMRIFAAKATLQVVLLTVFCSTLLVSSHAFLRYPSALFGAALCIGIASALACGVSQVGSSAVYPRFDWEHHREIGNSPRASTLSSIASGLYLTLALEAAAICGILHYFGYLEEDTMLLATGAGVLLSAALVTFGLVLLVRQRGHRHWGGA